MVENKQIWCANTSPLYIPADFFMVRTPVLPINVFFQMTAMTNNFIQHAYEKDAGERLEEVKSYTYQQLRSLLSQPLVEQALAIASNSLLEGIERIQQGEDSKRTERAYSRVLRYLIRMCSRPTPFGLFAGVAIGFFAEETTLQLAREVIQQTRTRPDMNWLFSLIQKIEQTADVVKQMRIMTNQTAYIAGGRVLLPSADAYGQDDNRAMSVRATPSVRYILEHAQQPILYKELLAKLLEAFSQVTVQQVEHILWQLWENHFLLTDLRPPLTSGKPTHYVLEHLRPIKGVESTVVLLQSVLEEVAALDQKQDQHPLERIRQLRNYQEQLVTLEKEQPPQIQVDTALQLEADTLHKSIGTIAAQAAEVLLRLTRLPQGLPHLQSYRMAFLERYGSEREVPLLELLSPEVGLDAPPTYQYPFRAYPLPVVEVDTSAKNYNTLLCKIVANAINDRSIEISLTDTLLEQLEQWSPVVEQAPLSLEVYLQLHAKSREALAHGEWQAIVSPGCGSPEGGRTFGRFFDVLAEEKVEALKRLIRYEEQSQPDIIFAELSYLPRQARAANVIIRPPLRSYEIVVGTTPSVDPDHVIPINDLVVGIDKNRFYLRSVRYGKKVIVRQSHMLNITTAPNICRFLTEVGQDGLACFSAFDWGMTASMPFLPRVVRDKLVLRPAQWNIAATTIGPTGSGSTELRWYQRLQEWRSQWRVPRYVYLTSFDNRLLLDLEHPLMATELHAELAKLENTRHVTIEELLPDFEHLWLQDAGSARYVSEIVVPLIRADCASGSSNYNESVQYKRSPHLITHKERYALPGGDWIYCKLYCAVQRQNELIVGKLRDVLQRLQQEDMIDSWFYIRYADPEPHIRIRLHVKINSSDHIHNVLAEVFAWNAYMVEQGIVSRFCLDTYEREIERYGGPKMINTIEQVFASDSSVVSNILAAQYTGHISIDSRAVAVYSLNRFFKYWGLDMRTRLQWLQKLTRKEEAKKEFREQRKLLCELLTSWEYKYEHVSREQRELLDALLAPLQEIVQKTAQQMRLLAMTGEIWVPEENIFASLAHMHINRLLEIDRAREQQIFAFWRHTLESLQLRYAGELAALA